MEITDIKIRKLFDNSKMCAVASVTFDDSLVVHDIKVIRGYDRLFLAMPSRRTPNDTFADIVHPTESNLRQTLEARVIEEYERVKNT